MMKPSMQHPVRTLVPVRPLDELIEIGAIKTANVDDIRKFDHTVNYMYLPANTELAMPESMALFYMPVTLHHDIIVDQRLAQLQYEAAQQLQRKLVRFYTSVDASREQFEPTT